MDCAQITQVQRLEPARSLLINHALVVAKGKSESFDTRIRCEAFFPDARNLPQKMCLVLVFMLVSPFSERQSAMYKLMSL